jgi:uncharacterized protein (UPF0128 family)
MTGVRGLGSRSDERIYLNNCLRKARLQNCEGCANRKVGHCQEWEVAAVVEALPLTRSLLHPFSRRKLLQPLTKLEELGPFQPAFGEPRCNERNFM